MSPPLFGGSLRLWLLMKKTAPDLDGQHSDSTQYSRIDNPINLDDIGLTLSETDSDIHHFKTRAQLVLRWPTGT